MASAGCGISWWHGAQSSASLAMGSLGLKCFGIKEQSCRKVLSPGAQQPSVPFPGDTLTQLTRSREWKAFGSSQRCEIQAEGGSGLEGWRKILLLPKKVWRKFLMKKWSFTGESGRGGKKHIKRVMKRKQSTLFHLHFAFPPLHSPLKQSPSCSWPSKLE